eukprot:6451_1
MLALDFSIRGTALVHVNTFQLICMNDKSADEEDVITPEYLGVRHKLHRWSVSESDIAYLETKLHELVNMNLDSAIMLLLQYKIELAHYGAIKNKGIHKVESPPYAFYDDDEFELPKTKKRKIKLNEMNKKLFCENKIEWIDYIQLQEDGFVDYRNCLGKFVSAVIMEKDGVELVLYTKEGQTVFMSFLDQYPFQRLFKAGSVTERISNSIIYMSIGSKVDLLCDATVVLNECVVVDIDIEDGTDDICRQIQIEFTMLRSKQLALLQMIENYHYKYHHCSKKSFESAQKLVNGYVTQNIKNCIDVIIPLDIIQLCVEFYFSKYMRCHDYFMHAMFNTNGNGWQNCYETTLTDRIRKLRIWVHLDHIIETECEDDYGSDDDEILLINTTSNSCCIVM